jgi:putative endonuclease
MALYRSFVRYPLPPEGRSAQPPAPEPGRKGGRCLRLRRATVIPAKAGIHVSIDEPVERWITALPVGRVGSLAMNADRTFFVYLLASGVRGTLYIGVTSDLLKRVWEHKNKAVSGFTARYDVDRLVWFETHATAEAAIQREKQLKEWKRDWKMNLIERDNPHWIDLFPGFGSGLKMPSSRRLGL